MASLWFLCFLVREPRTRAGDRMASDVDEVSREETPTDGSDVTRIYQGWICSTDRGRAVLL